MALQNGTCTTYKASQAIYINHVESLMSEKAERDYPFRSDDDRSGMFFSLKVLFGKKEHKWISIYLYNKSSRDVNVTNCHFKSFDHLLEEIANVKMSTENGTKNGIRKITASSNHGFRYFMKLTNFDEVKNNLRDWEIEIRCEVTYQSEELELEIEEFGRPRSLALDLLGLFDSKTDADVTFSINGKQIKAHKNILKATSQYFKTMFNSGMEESYSKLVPIRDCDPLCFETMLKFLYTDEPPSNLNEIASDLLPAADRFLLPQLKRHCANALKDCLNEENLKDTLIMAHSFNCIGLKRACFKMMDDLTRVTEWKELKQHGDLLFEFLEFLSKKPKLLTRQ